MRKQNKLNAIFIIIAALTVGLACGGVNADQADEANEAGSRANKKLDEAKDLFGKTEARNRELFSVTIRTPEQHRAYKSKMSGEAKSIVADYEKVVVMMKEVSKQFESISQMNLNEKFKSYAKLKADEYAVRAEAINIRKDNTQAFIDFDDPEAMVAKFDENKTKSDRLFRDAEDIGARAKKIESENKDAFGKS